MNVEELIRSLQQITDQQAEVIVRTEAGFNGIERVVVGSAGMCIHLIESEQPTPTHEPPRIEDMAPGTTFRAQDGKGRWRSLSRSNASVTSVVDLLTGQHFPAIHLDQSTIRDVQPPKETQ